MMLRWLGAAALLAVAAAGQPAKAASDWLEVAKLSPEDLRRLCEQARELTSIARSQLLSAGDADWRRLSRLNLAVDRIAMGQPPLDAGKCYVTVRAGAAEGKDGEVAWRAFEVHDFARSAERTRVMVVGWHEPLPRPE